MCGEGRGAAGDLAEAAFREKSWRAEATLEDSLAEYGLLPTGWCLSSWLSWMGSTARRTCL